MRKEDINKISDWLWEIPKSFRSDMRVPARIYVSEKMLEEVFRDESIPQLINGTTLPGIVKYGIAMPDCHEGYSVPIGFVGAISTLDGVISPGACGFDINCLHPDSLISTNFNTYLPITDLKKYQGNPLFRLSLLNKKSKYLSHAGIINFLHRKENRFLYSIKTKSGFNLKATGDHPIYTPAGMINIEELKINDQVVICPFKGLLYQEPENLELVNEEKILKALKNLGLPNNGNRWPQIIRWFKEKDFINLNLSSRQIPYLAKIIGYLIGDGTLNFITKRRAGAVSFYGRLKDLKQIKNDLEQINIKSMISSRERFHQFTNYYQKTYEFTVTEYSLRVSSTAFTVLLHLLGTPLGNKTFSDFQVPNWLWRAPLWQKRLFLAAFFGAEMSKPATLNKFNFYAPTLNINKAIPLKKSGIKFLNEIKKLLEELDISSGGVVEVEELANKGKTVGLRFQIDSSSGKLIKFFSTVGFEYHQEKQKLACLATAYLKQKEETLLLRQRVRKLARTLYNQGIPARVLVKDYSSNFIGKRYIEHSIWSNRGNPRIAFNFPSFKKFAGKHAFGPSSLIFDEIESVTKENYQGLVYDLTINEKNHNFIANNFVVSNCGMKLLKSEYSEKEIKSHLEDLATEIQKEVPSGLGRGRQIKLSVEQIDKILEGGIPQLVENGYGGKEDVENCEANGKLEWADASAVSSHAKNRGRDQVGTLGSGNHFLELQKVDEIFDEKVADAFGLFKDQVVIMIHTGSRGLGHQVCTDYLRGFIPLMEKKYKIRVPDREFACVPFNSPEGQRYFGAMASAANYAWANRQMITHFIRKAWKSVLGEKASPLLALYDVAHNIIKKEKYIIDGREIEVAVHRKGATRAFPNQPILIPGSMGTASYVLLGQKSGQEAFFSTCHGAGRTMSRHEAMRRVSGQEVVKSLESKDIIVKCHSLRGIAEEAPMAYKDVDEVVEVVHNAGLSKRVAKLVPLAVIKGE